MGKSWTHFLAEEIGQFFKAAFTRAVSIAFSPCDFPFHFSLRFRSLQLSFAHTKDFVFEKEAKTS
jgi:hypothetical protein